MVRTRWWELLLLALPGCLSILFLVRREFAAGMVLAALVVVLVASRAEIREPNVAGGYAIARGWLDYAKALALFAIYAVIVSLFFVSRVDHWTRDTPGRVAIWALAGLASTWYATFVASATARTTGSSAARWNEKSPHA